MNNMSYGFIYIIENNINNKIYIGQTIKNINKRFSEHKSSIRYRSTKLTNALIKHGKDNFRIKLLRSCNDQEELNYYEEQLIFIYESDNKNGYNIKSKVDGKGSMKESTKKKLSLSISKEEFNIYNLDGTFLGEYKIMRDVSEKFNISQSEISNCLNGKAYYVKDMIFIPKSKDTEENRSHKLHLALSNFKIERSIKVFLKTGEFVGDFKNINSFSRKYNLSQGNVYQCLIGKRSYVNKYIVIFSEDYTDKLLKEKIKSLHNVKTGILCCSNGKEYKNQKEAARDLNISQALVSNYINNKVENKKYEFWIK